MTASGRARPDPLPIDPALPEIVDAVRRTGAAVVVAPPGAGKTTRVPPALLALGPVILLQPRRIAARSLARRIAEEQAMSLGDEVGWHVRFERRFSRRTRILVVTEGILTQRLMADPLLEGFRVIVCDEIHERSLHGDLALALGWQAAQARGDLGVVAMSATVDAGPIASYLGHCPVVEVPSRPHPVAIRHDARSLPDAVRDAMRRPGGNVLAFLPGAGEIRRAAEQLSDLAASGVPVLPLHGSLDGGAQDLALEPSAGRRVILATNIAETSLTVEGVTEVVDSGLCRVLRYDAARGLDRLEVERISRDAADQRAGRAGRTGPGSAVRLWDPRDHLAPSREPEVSRVDLCGPCLGILAWGGDPRTFPWLTKPPPRAVDAALALLERLGALEGRRLTDTGSVLARFPLHPRLARVLLAAGGTARAAATCAVLSERDVVIEDPPTSDSDVLLRVDRLDRAPASVRDAARQIHDIARAVLPGGGPGDDDTVRRAILLGYPDRVARRREPGSPRLLLASGQGAVLDRRSAVRGGDFLVAVDVAAGEGEARVRSASLVDASWIAPTDREVVHVLDDSGSVKALERSRYHALVLSERPVRPDPEAAARLLAAELWRRGLDDAAAQVLARLRFAAIAVDLPALLRQACTGCTRLPSLDLAALLPAATRRRLDSLAPETLPVPSGRRIRLRYREDGEPVLAVKLQELFGLAETPCIGPRRTPVLLELLAPSGRPVQSTRDLRSFWDRTYPEVRRELRGRYPKHAWPEEPWSATPTARPRRTSPR